MVEVRVHSYRNPSGRCDRCRVDGNPVPGCCDEPGVIRPTTSRCPQTCDTGFAYCIRLSCRADPGMPTEPGDVYTIKGLSTREAGRGHATPHMPVETAKCWWLLKIEPNAWAGGKGSCAVCAR